MDKAGVFAVLVLVAGSAGAATYKCTGPNGGLVFSDRPCVGETVEEVELRHPPRPSGDAVSAEIWRLIGQSKVAVGMTADQARMSWGDPTDINRTVSGGGVREQWVYRRGVSQQYIYIEDGLVTSVTD